MSRARSWLPVVSLALCALAALSGCNNNNNSGISFAFKRPEHLDFACLAPYALSARADLRGQYAALPRACCTLLESSREPRLDRTPIDPAVLPGCSAVADQPVGSPVLHAMVTQSTRGEVAAVDLVNNRVLDSDRQIPGFTFIDSGGLPSAIVVPSYQPKGDVNQGPAFIYITSAEQGELRAIPLCRFRNGSRCGPDLDPANADMAGYGERLRVPLPSAPGDMVLRDDALWITLPDLGLIARVAMPALSAQGAIDAFEMAGEAAARRPAQPQFYRVSPLGAVELAPPVAEANEYVTTCGLGTPYEPSDIDLPLAPRAEPTDRVEPDRFYQDAESGLLVVTDRAAPGVHLFRTDSAGLLEERGALATGQPVRELVITPAVPELAVSGAGLLTIPSASDTVGPSSKRYLYAIDALGLVAVFDFVQGDDDDFSLTPLVVPAPDLTTRRFADRIGMPAPAQTLALIDTTKQSDYVCGEVPIDALQQRRSELARLPRPLSDELQREQARVTSRIVIHDTADTDYLRGVFVSVVSTGGVISMVDVHDLDTTCRAQKFCCATNGQALGANGIPQGCSASPGADGVVPLDRPRSTDAYDSLAVRRHALRRRSVSGQRADVATPALLQEIDCDTSDPRSAVRLQPQVCGPSDPWSSMTESWRVEFEGALPGSQTQYAHFEQGADASKLELVAPPEFDFCSRGVEPGDLVAVLGNAPSRLRGACPDPNLDSPPMFVIEEAYRDRLVVTPRADASVGETAASVRQRIVDCYPDRAGIELRSGGFVVIGANGTYLHRIVADASGACVANDDIDPRFDARMRTRTVQYTPQGQATQTITTEVFRNPFVTFALRPQQDGAVVGVARETSVSVTRASTAQQLTIVNTNDRVTDALPSTLRWMPEVGYLFLLDSAGQGLRRYTLRPFERDSTVFR